MSMKNFTLKYTIYICILTGGMLMGKFSGWPEWIGFFIALFGWFLLIFKIDTTKTNQ